VLTKGLPASPGAASGAAVFDSDTAEKRAAAGDSVILIRVETSPEDIHGMHAAKGILTARGGATSHAAVVARGLGLPCVAGCEAIRVDEEARQLRVDGRSLGEGDEISIDGTTGEVFAGVIATIDPNFDEEVDLRDGEALLLAERPDRLGHPGDRHLVDGAARFLLLTLLFVGWLKVAAFKLSFQETDSERADVCVGIPVERRIADCDVLTIRTIDRT